jgi:hypothetical protein
MENSRLKESKFENIIVDKSKVSVQGYDPSNDWNLKFLKKQDESVIA